MTIEHTPTPMFSAAGGGTGGGGRPERTKENMEAIERTPVAAALIAHALTRGARLEDIGPLLVLYCPHLLVNPAEPIAKSTVNGRVQRARREAERKRQPGETGNALQDYINYLHELHANTQLPEDVVDALRIEVRKYLRENTPPLYWLKDDECRALMLPLIPGLGKTGDEKIYPADIARVLSANFQKDPDHPKQLENKIVESYCARTKPEDMLEIVTQKPETLSDDLLSWGQTEASALLKETRQKSRESIGRPTQLDANPEARALAAALLLKGRPVKSVAKILERRGARFHDSVLYQLLKKHEDKDDPRKAAAEELTADADAYKDTAQSEAETAWVEYMRQSFENRYLKADIYQKPEICALLMVLLDETDLPPETIVRLANDRFKLKTSRDTLRRFVNNNGGRPEAATILLMSKPEITLQMLDAIRTEIPALLARRDELEEQGAAIGRKKRLETIAAGQRVAEMEAQWLANPVIQQLLTNIAQAPKPCHEYSTSRLAILRRMDAGGKRIMADGVTITLERRHRLETPDARTNQATVREFLATLMTDMDAGKTNALSELMDSQKFGYVQLREYGPKRARYGEYVYPIEIVKTVFRDIT